MATNLTEVRNGLIEEFDGHGVVVLGRVTVSGTSPLFL
jgi:hypothetical protein